MTCHSANSAHFVRTSLRDVAPGNAEAVQFTDSADRPVHHRQRRHPPRSTPSSSLSPIGSFSSCSYGHVLAAHYCTALHAPALSPHSLPVLTLKLTCGLLVPVLDQGLIEMNVFIITLLHFKHAAAGAAQQQSRRLSNPTRAVLLFDAALMCCLLSAVFPWPVPRLSRWWGSTPLRAYHGRFGRCASRRLASNAAPPCVHI